jgi:adenosylmethionine-8-amino-7-oxononanoate aminotransferase
VVWHAAHRSRLSDGAHARNQHHNNATQQNVLARLVIERVPSVEMVRFVSSGTEACLSVLRLMRAYTKREKVRVGQEAALRTAWRAHECVGAAGCSEQLQRRVHRQAGTRARAERAR